MGMGSQALAAAVGIGAAFGVPAAASASENLGSWYFYNRLDTWDGHAGTGITGMRFRLAFGEDAYFGRGIDLFEDYRFTPADALSRFAVNATNDSDYTAIAALLTNGNPNDSIWHESGPVYGTDGPLSAGRWSEAFWAAHVFSTAPADFSGYRLDQIVLVVDAADWTSPGSDPNGNGVWTDYLLKTHVEFFGTAVPEPATALITGLAGAALLRRRRP